MTQPVFQALPVSNPPDPHDVNETPILVGDPIAYAVADGYLHTGVVRDVIHTVKDVYNWQTQRHEPQWSTRLKVQTLNSESKHYKNKQHVSLTKMFNIVVLRGPEADAMKKAIEDSWVDKPL